MAKTIKKVLELWLKNNLKLTLSPTKTLITDLHQEKAHFLGYEIFKQTNSKIVNRPRKEGQEELFAQRYAGRLQIMPDVERLYNKFKIKNYLREDKRVLSVGVLTVLEDHQIIHKFNQFMVGLGMYYITEISRPSALNYWNYILYYSALKTLSHKHRSSVSQIIKQSYLDLSKPDILYKYQNKISAYDPRIVSSYKRTDGTKVHVTLLNYNESMMTIKKIREKYRDDYSERTFDSQTIEFLILHKNNWRTKFKLNTMCSICSSTDKLEMHHIVPLKNQNNKSERKYKNFDKLVAALNRKQFCVCRLCHEEITFGRYNRMALRDLIDLRLVAPEGLLQVIGYKAKNNAIKEKENSEKPTYDDEF